MVIMADAAVGPCTLILSDRLEVFSVRQTCKCSAIHRPTLTHRHFLPDKFRRTRMVRGSAVVDQQQQNVCQKFVPAYAPKENPTIKG